MRYANTYSRYAAERANTFERQADQSWYRAISDTINDHVTALNLEAAMTFYDRACAAYREADRLEERYGRKIAA